MVVSVPQTVLADSLVSVHLASLVHAVKIKILVAVNPVRMVVFVSALARAPTHANVQPATRDKTVNRVR